LIVSKTFEALFATPRSARETKKTYDTGSRESAEVRTKTKRGAVGSDRLQNAAE
jgi:hypothetical protein